MKTEVRQAILGLNHRGIYDLLLMEEAGAEIHRLYEYYILFEIPQFGGEPGYVDTYHYFRIDDMIKKIESWT